MIAQAAVRKYPNPFSTSVTGVDIVHREVDQNGVLNTHKLLTTDWNLPDIATKLLGLGHHGHVSEHSSVDPKTGTYTLKSRNVSTHPKTGTNTLKSRNVSTHPKTGTNTLKSRNLTFSNVILIEEKLVYSPHPHDKNKTVLHQEANVTINSHIPWLTGKIEKWVTDSMANNAGKGRQGMEWVIEKIQVESRDLNNAFKSMDSFLSGTATSTPL
ncbi:hypothetical protein FSP39_015817 [Pinctada imbricata]|uniref:PRELI/MSF1 domain-containing protein n=1 Tax=Pinctada imbricata TaxID=66713 RepID=A0AA88XJ35_PINIB|nr:hypothetical protein FSP39_015817 [Pinctada imbricata]